MLDDCCLTSLDGVSTESLPAGRRKGDPDSLTMDWWNLQPQNEVALSLINQEYNTKTDIEKKGKKAMCKIGP
jgi:hypothetical protein